MRIVISGAAGFIASHMCDRLVKDGHTVLGLDNLLTGSRENLQQLNGHPGFSFVHHDVIKALPPINGHVDMVLHMASPASPKDYLEHPIETLEVGSVGTKNMLDLARSHGAKFLLTSTSETYGDPLQHPQVETYWGNVNPIGPRSCYDESKRFAEAMTMAYHRVHGVQTRIVRIFNTYGPRMRLRDGRVVPNFISQALKGEDVTVYGDGSQTRSFCFVSDLVEGITRLLHSDRNEPVNIGNPTELTVLEFAQRIIELTGSQSKVTYKPLPVDDPKVRQPDITVARQVLGWEPKVSLQDGLKKTITYFKEKLGPA